MFSLACLFLSIAILSFILKYRVHIHVHYSSLETQPSRQARVSNVSKPPRHNTAVKSDVPEVPSGTRAGVQDNAIVDVMSALINLQVKPARARQIASRVCSSPGDFDSLLRRAIQEAA